MGKLLAAVTALTSRNCAVMHGAAVKVLQSVVGARASRWAVDARNSAGEHGIACWLVREGAQGGYLWPEYLLPGPVARVPNVGPEKIANGGGVRLVAQM